MLKKIKLIQGVGNFTKTSAGAIDFGEVTIIYGENRNGKSTLCDVIHSLSEDDPNLILHRRSIPSDQSKPPKVEFMFDTVAGNFTSKFENGQWQVKTPVCSKLYVFDHSFIHRNVITGQKQERPNSENMTSFILGENSIGLFNALAGINNSLREERANISNLEGQFKIHTIYNVPEFVKSPLPTESREQLEKNAAELDASKQQIINTLQNIDKIKQRSILNYVGTQINFSKVCESINNLLALSLQDVHQGSLVILQNHMSNHVNNSATFKGWASQGITQIKDSCPFCGQFLNSDAQGLIAAYQQAFNAEFDRFSNQVRNNLNTLRQPFAIPNTRESIIQQHQYNKQVIGLYTESEIASNQVLTNLIALLDQRLEDILSHFDAVISYSLQATEFWTPKLEQKFAVPYEPAQLINFNVLVTASTTYSQSIYEYWVVSEQINEIFNTFKSSLSEAQLKSQLSIVTNQQMLVSLNLKRIALEPLCINYKQKLEQVNSLELSYKTQKQQLEQSQADYLDKYFYLINELFQQLGSSHFEIIKVPNSRGKQVIYDLRVKFRGQDIPADKINTVFSESDRRALALCIFLAKVMSLPADEQAKAILVLDDPVTSFDNERIALILNKLDELQRTIKQLVITTHYKGMAAKALRKFKKIAKAVKLVNGFETCVMEAVEIDDMIATEHDAAFKRIKAFVNRENNDDILTTLRPFFEGEIRYRFRKQLIDLGEAKSDLAVCITALRNNQYITPLVETRLSSIRDTLNTPMHEISGDSIENTRALADQILNVIYNEL